MFKNLPFQLLVCLIGGLLIGDYLSNQTISYFFSISCLLKDILMFILPIVIFSYLFAAILSFERQAPFLIMIIVLLVVLSNATAVLTAYGVCKIALPFLGCEALKNLNMSQETIEPMWAFPLAPLISPDKAMLGAVLAGLGATFIKKPIIKSFAFRLRDWATTGLKKGFIPFLPLYVLGFVLKLDRDGALGILLQSYGRIFILGCILIIVYISFMYALAAGFRWHKFVGYLKEMLPAGVTGFSTMSSAATMPLTLAAAEKNLNNREYADFVVPTTVNIHMVGDGLNIALTALVLLVLTGNPFPDLSVYLVFVFYYCITKFSAAGIPGGGVIVILPVIQTHLGLSPEATSMLATIYILQDPILTAANVMGNGAFALLTGKLLKKAKNNE